MLEEKVQTLTNHKTIRLVLKALASYIGFKEGTKTNEETMPAAIEVTPTDPLTKLPLPLMMSWADFYEPDGKQRPYDYHHGFHPENSYDLGRLGSGKPMRRDDPQRLSGRAVRFSRGQEVPTWIHDRYHEIFYGPELPETPKEKFAAVVLACAGVVPREAIDLYATGEYKIRTLDDRDHNFIRRRTYFENAPKLHKTSQRNHIGSFLAQYILDNGIEEIANEKSLRENIRNFLIPKNEAMRIASARRILTAGMEISLIPLLPVYKLAEEEGMVKEPNRKLGKAVLKFFTIDRFPDYFGALEDRLPSLSV